MSQEAELVRTTYLKLETTGVADDGFSEGLELTRDGKFNRRSRNIQAGQSLVSLEKKVDALHHVDRYACI